MTGPSADLPSKARVVRVRAEEHDGAVPRISAFYGIVIEMYFADRPPPHFHAPYGGEEATIVIASARSSPAPCPASTAAGARMVGGAPPRS